MKKILFIAHYFPPIGGAGVQRSVKFVKHLPSCGVLPVVLTGPGTSTGKWTPADHSLIADIPPEVPVYRTAAPSVSESSRSARALAYRSALARLGDTIIAEHRPEAIFVTMSPFDHAIVARELSQRHGLPWLADLRDPWALDEFQVYPSRWHRMQAQRSMRQALESASSVIMNTPVAMRKFRTTFPELADRAQVSITNGFDADDFVGETRELHPGKFTIVHSGYFHAELGLRQRRRSLEYRLLGRTEPGVEFLPRSHYYLIKALEHLQSTAPSVADRIRVICLGSANEVDADLVRNSTVQDMFEFTGYLPHAESIRHVRGASLLFLPMHKMPAGQAASIVPGKTYEYLASGRPILAAVPPGDALDFVKACPHGRLCEPDDVRGMARAIEDVVATWAAGGQTQPLPPPEPPSRFERRTLTEQLAQHLCSVLTK